MPGLNVRNDFNASVTVYDPYTATHDLITFPGITNNEMFHMSGIDFDAQKGIMVFVASAGAPFVSSGANLTGPNYIFRYDTTTRKVLYKADMGGFLATVQEYTGLAVNGIQDIATDSQGNTYAPVSFGAKAVARIAPDGRVSAWFTTNKTGTVNPKIPTTYSGLIFYEPSNRLVITDGPAGTFVTFNTKAAVGVPRSFKMTGLPSDYAGVTCDGLLNPSRYPHRDVLLCSEDFLGSTGAITVFTSADHWKSAHYAGRIPNNDPRAVGSIPTATVEIVNSLYISPFFISVLSDPRTAGNRSSFPFFDITSMVDALVIPLGVSVIS